MFERISERISPEDYLAAEERAEYKSEYFDGEVFAMAGGTPEHNLISANVIRELGVELEKHPCRVYSSDQRVAIPGTGLYTYPDVTVVCGEARFEDASRRALVNPIVILEVLSDSTEAYDRGGKFAHYRRLASLQEYVLVASDRHRIERFTRLDDGSERSAGWTLAECIDRTGAISLDSIACVLSLSGVYRKVEFPERPRGTRRGPA